MTSSLRESAAAFDRSLWKTKLSLREKSFWYPYDNQNVAVLERLLASSGRDLLQLCHGPHGRIADIGSADGNHAFFLEQLGFGVDVIDYAPTNYNKLEGARLLKKALNSSVTIRNLDLDSQFGTFSEKYDAVFFLGTLYHLKNPFFVMERLARTTPTCFFSTKVARQTADGRPLSAYPLAYLLAPDECNNDATNFWVFSEAGLKRLFERTGWSVAAYGSTGNATASTPADPDKDERAFCLLQSEVFS